MPPPVVAACRIHRIMKNITIILLYDLQRRELIHRVPDLSQPNWALASTKPIKLKEREMPSKGPALILDPI